MSGPVQSCCHEGSPVGNRSLRWEGFVEKVGFEPGVKEEGVMDDEKVNRNKNGETDGVNLEVVPKTRYRWFVWIFASLSPVSGQRDHQSLIDSYN